MPLPQKRYYYDNNDSVLRSAYLEHDQNSNEQTTNEIRGIFRHENDIKEKKISYKVIFFLHKSNNKISKTN